MQLWYAYQLHLTQLGLLNGVYFEGWPLPATAPLPMQLVPQLLLRCAQRSVVILARCPRLSLVVEKSREVEGDAMGDVLVDVEGGAEGDALGEAVGDAVGDALGDRWATRWATRWVMLKARLKATRWAML